MRRLGQDITTGSGCLTHLGGLAEGDRLLTELHAECLGGRGLKRKDPDHIPYLYLFLSHQLAAMIVSMYLYCNLK